MNKLITPALIAAALLIGGIQAANAQSSNRATNGQGSENDREHVCKQELQLNCT